MLFFRGKPVFTSPLNPRIETKGKDIAGLARTIRATGGPVQKMIFRDEGDHWEIIIGSRRAEALERMYSEIPEEFVKIMQLSDAEASEIIAAEALSSMLLSPIEKGKVCKQLMEEYPTRYPVQEAVSKRLGISQETVSRYISLYDDYSLAHKEDPTIQDCVNIVDFKKKPNQISIGAFREIAVQFRDQPKIMAEVTKRAARLGLTRSQIRAARHIFNRRPNASVKEILDEVQRASSEEKGASFPSRSVDARKEIPKDLALCIDLGLSGFQWAVTVALGNAKGQILARITEEIDEKGPETIDEQIIRMIHLIQTKRIGGERIRGIGIGTRGLIDLRKGMIKPPGGNLVPLVEPLEEEFGMPVRLLGDCCAAVLAEKMFGEGRGSENLVHVTLGRGIGAGVYVNGHLLVGKDGNANEIGHLVIDYGSESSLLCSCGKRGHWEAYCSAYGIPNYARSVLSGKKTEELESSLLMRAIRGKVEKITAKSVFDCARSGDPIPREIVEGIGIINSIGCSCIVHAYDPSLITIGGYIAMNWGSMVVDTIRRQAQKYCISPFPQIKISPLGEDIVLQGASAMVFYDYLN